MTLAIYVCTFVCMYVCMYVRMYVRVGQYYDIIVYTVILKCHDNRYRRDFFSIVISPMQYYC